MALPAGTMTNRAKKAFALRGKTLYCIAPVKFFLLRHRHLFAIVLLCLAVGAVWCVRAAGAHGWLAHLHEWAMAAHDLLRDAPPLVYFTAAGVLPMAGIPIISFYLLTASLYPPHIAILGTAYSVILNLLLSYLVGRVCHRWISALVARTGRQIPQIPPRHRMWMTAVVRVTPGAPLMVQNYILVLAGVPLTVFLSVSFMMEMLIAAGYVLLGHSLFTGNWKLLAVAVAVVLVAVGVVRVIRRRAEAQAGGAAGGATGGEE